MSLRVPERVIGRYLGYRLDITDYDVTVYTPTGKEIGTVQSLSRARRIVRHYRKTGTTRG